MLGKRLHTDRFNSGVAVVAVSSANHDFGWLVAVEARISSGLDVSFVEAMDASILLDIGVLTHDQTPD